MKNVNKILKIAVILLLVTNIALVFLLVSDKGRGPDKRGSRPDPAALMAKELGMNDKQVAEHKQLKDDHFKMIRPLYDSLRAAKSAYFGLVKDSTASDSLIAAYHQRLNQRQNEIDSLTFAHFKKVRSLFTPEQQPKFDEFVQKMMQRGRKDSTAKNK